MSLVGKNAKFSVYKHEKLTKVTGIILDKFQNLKEVTVRIASHNGAGDVRRYIPIDYYLVQTVDSLEKVECSDIREILN